MSAPPEFAVLAGQRCLVFGAAGFLGRWVAKELASHGARSVLVVRDEREARRVFDSWEVLGDVRQADLSQIGVATALIELVRPAMVFNLAGYGVDRSERDAALALLLNAELPGEIAAALGRARDLNWDRQAFVHAGSALEYGTTGGHLDEEGPATPTTLYGGTKLAGTTAVVTRARAAGLRALVARLFTVYGPGEHDGRLLPSLLDAARNQRELPLSEGLQRRDFTWVGDVAEGLVRLALTPASRAAEASVVNLATGKLASVREFALTAARVLALPAEKLCFGALPTRPEEMAHGEVSIRRLEELAAGWKPRTGIEEGVGRTRAFLAERGLFG